MRMTIKNLNKTVGEGTFKRTEHETDAKEYPYYLAMTYNHPKSSCSPQQYGFGSGWETVVKAARAYLMTLTVNHPCQYSSSCAAYNQATNDNRINTLEDFKAALVIIERLKKLKAFW